MEYRDAVPREGAEQAVLCEDAQILQHVQQDAGVVARLW